MVTLKGSLGAGVAWESNLFHLPPGGRRRGDVRIAPALTLEAERDIGSKGVSVRGDLRYDRYAREHDLDALNMQLDGRAHMRIAGRCHAKAGLGYERRRSDPADVGTATARPRTWDTSLSLGCPRPAGFHPQLVARIIDQSQNGDLGAFYDVRTASVSPELLYSRPSLGTAAVSFAYGRVDRPAASPFASFDFQRGGVRLERYVAPRLGGSLALGYVRFRPDEGRDHGMAEWRVDARWLLPPDGSITARFAREARAEGNVAAAIARVTSADLGVSLQLGGRSRLSARAEREWRDFRDALPTSGRPERDEDRTTRLSVQLEYRLSPALLLDAQVTHAKRDATPSSYRYRSTGTGLRVRYTF